MKRLIFTLITAGFTTALFAQNNTDSVFTTTTTITTTTTAKGTVTDTVIRKKRKLKFSFSTENRDTVYKEASKHPGWSFTPTFSRVDIGFATLVDNGSFTLSPENEFLRYRSWKSSNFGFDLLELGYRFNSSFKIYASAGFDWTRFRLRENVTPLRFQDQLTYSVDDIDYDKNVFSSTYLRIPLSFYWRSKNDNAGHRFHIVAGPIMGILIDGHVRQKSLENGDQHFRAGFNLAKVRYGGFLRAGYGGIGFFAKYYANDMFEDSPAQKGLKNFSFGATVGF